MNLRTPETIGSPAPALQSVAVLLRNLIDYAGLFPPLSLGMSAAVTNYETYLQSEHGWMLGRFIVPVARLAEFEEALAQLPVPRAESTLRWQLSVLLGADACADLARIREFNSRAPDFHLPIKSVICSVEVKIASPEEIERLAAVIPAKLEAYFEIPLSGCGTVGPEPSGAERRCIAAIAASGRRAKIRTGGERPDEFPAPESVIEFMRLCAEAHVPFKATAGLHHPLRSVHPLTYEPGSPSGLMHGFLNVFLAAAFLRAGMEPATALELLKEQSPHAFRFDWEGTKWREHRLLWRQIAGARQNFSVSFGSCSFAEPIEDLQSLHLL